MSKGTFRIETLGCKVNQYESEAMAALFVQAGYGPADPDQAADFVIINTCTVTNVADRKSRQMINRAKRTHPNAVIAVVGCYVQVNPDQIKEMDGVDVLLGTQDRALIVDLCERARESGLQERVMSLEEGRDFESLFITSQSDQTRAYLKIQEGCNMFCSYCIIPYARGPIRSRDLEEIRMEAQRLAWTGYQEIVLTGIHIASYGLEKPGLPRLIDVIEAVARVEGIERIRLGSLEPGIITETFLKRLVKIPEVCDHFHLSLQSGSDAVLARMNRKYRTQAYMEKVTMLREAYPFVGITTDIIVGFPGETPDEFQESLDFVEALGFLRVHVFPYSPRAGTPAAKMPDQVAGNVKKDRVALLMEKADQVADQVSQSMLGEDFAVLFEVDEDGISYGHATNDLYVAVRSEQEISGEIHQISLKCVDSGQIWGILK